MDSKLKLKEIRIQRHKKQEEVAAYLNISRAAYTNIENGKRDPDSNTIFLLAEFFSVPIDDLFGRRPPNVDSPDKPIRMKELRERLRLSAIDAAKALDMSLTKYIQFEQSEVNPSINELIRISDFYGVSIDSLVGHSESKNKEDIYGTNLTNTEINMIKDFRSLNKQGQEYVLQSVAMSIRIYKSADLPDMEKRAK